MLHSHSSSPAVPHAAGRLAAPWGPVCGRCAAAPCCPGRARRESGLIPAYFLSGEPRARAVGSRTQRLRCRALPAREGLARVQGL